jgi:hypothetical protein
MRVRTVAIVSIWTVAGLLAGFALGVHVGRERHLPFVEEQMRWSIGIYAGPSPLELAPPEGIENPVLVPEDVTDVQAQFLADPFMVPTDSTWFMFFEVYNAAARQGDIGLASSPDGMHWTYQEIVLDEPFHLSYPHVFEWGGRYYMTPESYEAFSLRLYRAEDFPRGWTFVGTLRGGINVDPTVFRHDDRWWMYVSTSPWGDGTLRLFGADSLAGEWREHPASPLVVDDPNGARPGGRVVSLDGRLLRFAQDDYPGFGNRLVAFEILRLTPDLYEERRVEGGPVLQASGSGWNADGMHHADAHRIGSHRWIACVDGGRWIRRLVADY